MVVLVYVVDERLFFIDEYAIHLSPKCKTHDQEIYCPTPQKFRVKCKDFSNHLDISDWKYIYSSNNISRVNFLLMKFMKLV
jgi:hypothetical protein